MDDKRFTVIEGGKDHGTKKCDCLFCQCCCPVCGDHNIEVAYRPEWQLDNDMENTIAFRRMGDFIRFECPECGEREDGDLYQSDKDLSPLMRFFQDVLHLPTDVMMGFIDDGTISVERGYPYDSVYMD